MESLMRRMQERGISFVPDYPLAPHSSFRIGGSARLAIFPADAEEMRDVCREVAQVGVSSLVIGNASNVVFSDDGFDGVVIFTERLRQMQLLDGHLFVGAGCRLSAVSAAARDASLTGLEFAQGIPGTVGGAVFMNAGAFGGCMEQVCVRSVYLDPDSGEISELVGEAQEFGIRTSFYERHPRLIILSAELSLTPDRRELITARMEDFAARRRATQPLEYPSAGSVFKRPVGHFAGRLIEDCGLKGTRIGGAEVSEKHAGFIVNRGGARASDVRALVELIRTRVLEKFGVELECEIRFV